MLSLNFSAYKKNKPGKIEIINHSNKDKFLRGTFTMNFIFFVHFMLCSLFKINFRFKFDY